MNSCELEDYLTELRNSGKTYDYTDGYRAGYESTEVDLEEYLTMLRNTGETYDYIEGYEDGYRV